MEGKNSSFNKYSVIIILLAITLIVCMYLSVPRYVQIIIILFQIFILVYGKRNGNL